MASNVVQHHPDIESGRHAFMEYMHTQTIRGRKLHRLVGEGNFVLAQSEGLKEKAPYVFYDLLRLDNGLIVEMWQVSQAIPEDMAHGNGMI